MSVKSTLATIRRIGLSARYNGDTKEYRVTYPLDSDLRRVDAIRKAEDQAYYTNDAYDAISTALRMADTQ